MTLGEHFARTGRGLAIGAAVLAAVGLTTVPRPAHALSPAAGVGIGLGAFAAGTALGAAANPYYNPYYNPWVRVRVLLPAGHSLLSGDAV